MVSPDGLENGTDFAGEFQRLVGKLLVQVQLRQPEAAAQVVGGKHAHPGKSLRRLSDQPTAREDVALGVGQARFIIRAVLRSTRLPTNGIFQIDLRSTWFDSTGNGLASPVLLVEIQIDLGDDVVGVELTGELKIAGPPFRNPRPSAVRPPK